MEDYFGGVRTISCAHCGHLFEEALRTMINGPLNCPSPPCGKSFHIAWSASTSTPPGLEFSEPSYR
jgi:hypothetical protein